VTKSVLKHTCTYFSLPVFVSRKFGHFRSPCPYKLPSVHPYKRGLVKSVYIVTMFVHGDTTHVLLVKSHQSVQAENNVNYCIYKKTLMQSIKFAGPRSVVN